VQRQERQLDQLSLQRLRRRPVPWAWSGVWLLAITVVTVTSLDVFVC
jgi:hypothetical protein